jgi:hypothetical protein
VQPLPAVTVGAPASTLLQPSEHNPPVDPLTLLRFRLPRKCVRTSSLNDSPTHVTVDMAPVIFDDMSAAATITPVSSLPPATLGKAPTHPSSLPDTFPSAPAQRRPESGPSQAPHEPLYSKPSADSWVALQPSTSCVHPAGTHSEIVPAVRLQLVLDCDPKPSDVPTTALDVTMPGPHTTRARAGAAYAAEQRQSDHPVLPDPPPVNLAQEPFEGCVQNSEVEERLPPMVATCDPNQLSDLAPPPVLSGSVGSLTPITAPEPGNGGLVHSVHSAHPTPPAVPCPYPTPESVPARQFSDGPELCLNWSTLAWVQDSFGVHCTMDSTAPVLGPALHFPGNTVSHSSFLATDLNNQVVYMQPGKTELSRHLQHYSEQKCKYPHIGAVLVVPATCSLATYPELELFTKVHTIRKRQMGLHRLP